MLNYIKSIYRKLTHTRKPIVEEYRSSVLMETMGYTHTDTLLERSDWPCECLNCGMQWDNRIHKVYSSSTIKLYANCSQCLDITQIPPDRIEVTQEGKRYGVKVLP